MAASIPLSAQTVINFDLTTVTKNGLSSFSVSSGGVTAFFNNPIDYDGNATVFDSGFSNQLLLLDENDSSSNVESFEISFSSAVELTSYTTNNAGGFSIFSVIPSTSAVSSLNNSLLSDGTNAFNGSATLAANESADWQMTLGFAEGGYFTDITVTTVPVPEPSTALLGGVAASFMLGRRKRG